MIKILVDSGCDLNDEMKNKDGIETIPLTLQIDNESFLDNENLDVNEFLNKMEKCNSIKSAAPSPETFLEKFKGEESIFVVTINSIMSGTYNSAMLARQMYFDEIGEKFIHIFDSRTVCCGETAIAMKINELVKLNFSELEIVERVNEFIENQRFYFILERFENLVKTGRANPVIAKIASVLNIYPICTVNRDTLKIEMLNKARGLKKTVSKLIDYIEKEGQNLEDRMLVITHVQCLDKANYVKDELLKRFKFKGEVILEPTGICTMYANRGGVMISF